MALGNNRWLPAHRTAFTQQRRGPYQCSCKHNARPVVLVPRNSRQATANKPVTQCTGNPRVYTIAGKPRQQGLETMLGRTRGSSNQRVNRAWKAKMAPTWPNGPHK